MPFTFSHPAIILPLQRFLGRWFSLTGLVIGSMVPDFEYFIRMKSLSIYSHTLKGLLWFDLPLGLLLCFVFHNLVRNSLFSHLPHFLNSRLSNFKRFSWNSYFQKNWLIVIVSVLIGALSHLLWDQFTHENTYIYKLYSILDKNVAIPDSTIEDYEILQGLSSFIGGLAVFFSILQLPVTDKVKRPFYFSYWYRILIIMAAVITIRYFTGLKIIEFREVLVNLIASFFLAIVLTGLFLRKQYYR